MDRCGAGVLNCHIHDIWYCYTEVEQGDMCRGEEWCKDQMLKSHDPDKWYYHLDEGWRNRCWDEELRNSKGDE